MVLEALRDRGREQPEAIAVGLTAVAYAAVAGTFLLELPYPALSEATVLAMNHAIAAINTTTIAVLAAGWYWIRRGRVRRHRAAMITATVLILTFLLIYLFRVGGGGERYLAGAPDVVHTAYLLMLAVHVLLSILAVPLVVYALVLGLSHTPAALRDTRHAQVGRIAVGAWLLSLALGVLTYVILDHVYTYEFAGAALAPWLMW